MDGLKQLDLDIVVWLNGWVGRYGALDNISDLLVSDYFIPVILALSLLWLWFSTKGLEARFATQRAILTAIVSLGMANLAVLLLNDVYFRPRPFTEAELNLLFYRPTDSSFPANPAALSFALAFSVLQGRRAFGMVLLGLASVWTLSRVYAGVFYLSDGAAGAAIGVTAAWGMRFLLCWLEPLPTTVLRVGRALHLA